MAQTIRSALVAIIVGLPLAALFGATPPAYSARAAETSGQPATPEKVPSVPSPAVPDKAVPGAADSKPGGPALTGGEAWKALVGNTISGTTPDGSYLEFFAPDGTVIHVDRDGKDSGRWTLKEPAVCFTYPDEEDEDCRKPQVEGAHGSFLDSDGSTYRFDILPGNPRHL